MRAYETEKEKERKRERDRESWDIRKWINRYFNSSDDHDGQSLRIIEGDFLCVYGGRNTHIKRPCVYIVIINPSFYRFIYNL